MPTQLIDSRKKIHERPRICCIDLNDEDISKLEGLGYNIYSGTLGNKVNVPNKNIHDYHELLLDFKFPPNLHEYDIIIINLHNDKTVEYDADDHTRNNHTGKSALSLLSSYPETVFDPRPLGSQILKNKLNKIGNRLHLILSFTTGDYSIEYQPVKITEGNFERQKVEEYNIYAFANGSPTAEAKLGKEMYACDIKKNLKNLLSDHIGSGTYNQTFFHPTSWDQNNKQVPNQNYTPLIKNSNGDIVSIFEARSNSLRFYFPQFQNKFEFLSIFLSTIAPTLAPQLFPYSTTFSWKDEKEYWLPNHEKLTKEKELLEIKFEKIIKSKESEIASNIESYSFLHNIITETGDALVGALVNFLKWLEFKNVVKVDETKKEGKILEEDIQVEMDEGLLIIECKGIGGTSTDSDCSQVSKVKHRRCKERNNFDVFALYIVNHQRYLPPLQRTIPPFTKIQIQDAHNDERGLLSTWQLFNLYFEIENRIISKKEAREELLKYGLVEFRPTNLIFVFEPKEILKNNTVCIIKVSKTNLKVGDELFIEKNGRFYIADIKEIQQNSKPVLTANSGEIGLLLSKPIFKKSKIWMKPKPAKPKNQIE